MLRCAFGLRTAALLVVVLSGVVLVWVLFAEEEVLEVKCECKFASTAEQQKRFPEQRISKAVGLVISLDSRKPRLGGYEDEGDYVSRFAVINYLYAQKHGYYRYLLRPVLGLYKSSPYLVVFFFS